jgi:hypothetical protein
MSWRSVSLTASSCALLLAACGGNGRHAAATPPPRIPAAVAARLAADATRVASIDGCAARGAAIAFRRDVIASISRVPTRYQEPLTSAANDLVSRIPPCPQPVEENDDEAVHEHGHKSRGKHKHRKGHS